VNGLCNSINIINIFIAIPVGICNEALVSIYFISFFDLAIFKCMTTFNMTLKCSRSSLRGTNAKLSYTYVPIAKSTCLDYRCLQLERNHESK